MNTIRELKQQEKYKSMLKRKNKELRELKDQLQQKENIIKEVRELLSKYNDNESNYYAPIDMALYLLDEEK